MSRAISRLAGAGAAITVASVIAACGSSSPRSSTASNSRTAPSQAQLQQQRQEMVRFANCMRSHGVTNLPDPEASPYDFKFAFSPSSGNLRSPTFQSADAACQHLLPGGGEPNHGAPPSHAQTVALLALARCMRSHGFRDFPDPNNGGEITHEMLATAGLNLHQPAFAQDADDCVSVTHGLITKARVARFIAGQ